MNETHDPTLRSWLPDADRTGGDFPIQNLPFGVFRRRASGERFRAGVAIGDQILDLTALHGAALLDAACQEVCATCLAPDLNAYLARGPNAWSTLRIGLSRLLRMGSPHVAILQSCLLAQDAAEYTLPMVVGDYTDFYSSLHHATRVGALFRPDAPLLPNYKWIPIAYHGRASSLVISGTEVVRPRGQALPRGATTPVVQPSARLDYEAELGLVVGVGNPLGRPVALEAAESHVYGVCLLNDWSARDVQGWEYQPLGPFAGKNFATTLSPWLVSLEAIAPFRSEWSRAAHDPQPLSYLESEHNRRYGALDVQVEIHLQTAAMRAAGSPAQRLTRASYRDAYWTLAQLVTHHTLNGCALRPGDVLGTGTISGATVDQAGCLLELTAGGKQPLQLANGETRTFLEDGDEVTLSAFCERQGAVRIGFGRAVGRVAPSVS